MNKLNLRTVEFTSAENSSTQLGYFHLFKKEVEPNGSENIYGIIENIETGKLYKTYLNYLKD